jgi:glycosyltransferase involved in cell wall biosynthesis
MRPNRILYIQYTNPAGYPPLQHSSRILADAGWQVLFLGTGAHGANNLRFPPHPNITVRQMPFCPAGWRQKLHYLRYALWVLFWTLRWRPQWVYASDSLVCPIARVLAFLPAIRIIYHEHDSPTPVPSHNGRQQQETPKASAFERWVLRSRTGLARRAQLCIIPNELRRQHFVAETGANGNTRCIWNCPSRDEVSSMPTRRASGLIVWYHGSIVPTQLPETVVRALALLPAEVILEFAGYETVGHPGYVQNLLALAQTLGIGDRVRYRGTVPDRSALLDLCSRCHVGVALFPQATRQPMAGASNKPFDYLAAGLALLVSDFPEWRDCFVAPGLARACNPDDPESIAEALLWFLHHDKETRNIGLRGMRRINDEWNYDHLFDPVQLMVCQYD